MRSIVTRFQGTIAQTYFMDKGDKIPKHFHNLPHTCTLLQGSVEIEIYDGRLFTMEVGATEELPPVIPHEIRALVDNTMVVNVSVGAITTNGAEQAKSGGVLLHDGTVVYP